MSELVNNIITTFKEFSPAIQGSLIAVVGVLIGAGIGFINNIIAAILNSSNSKLEFVREQNANIAMNFYNATCEILNYVDNMPLKVFNRDKSIFCANWNKAWNGSKFEKLENCFDRTKILFESISSNDVPLIKEIEDFVGMARVEQINHICTDSPMSYLRNSRDNVSFLKKRLALSLTKFIQK